MKVVEDKRDEVKVVVVDMFLCYLDVFFKNDEDLGRISLVEYLINIGDSRLLRQFLWKVFLVFEGEEKKVIDIM